MTMEQPILNPHNKEEHRPSHTAEHLLNQTMVKMLGCERSKNAHIERKKSKINYNLAECPTLEQIAEIEHKMNELIDMDLPVTYEFVTRDNIPEGVKLDNCQRMPAKHYVLYALAITTSVRVSVSMLNLPKKLKHSRLQVRAIMKAPSALCLR